MFCPLSRSTDTLLSQCFRRRTYRLADQQNAFIQLVHYRNCEGDAYVRRTRKNSLSKQEKSDPVAATQPYATSFDSSRHLQYPIFESTSYGTATTAPGESSNDIFFSADDQMDEVDYQVTVTEDFAFPDTDRISFFL
jgi:hypothetical protein